MLAFGERRYRVRGLPKQLTEALKVNVLVTSSAVTRLAGSARRGRRCTSIRWICTRRRQRRAFAKARPRSSCVAEESVIQHDLGRLLLKLEQVIDERAKAAESPGVAPLPAMTAEDTAAALAFLRDANLIERIVADCRARGPGRRALQCAGRVSRLRQPQARIAAGGADPDRPARPARSR